MTHDDHDMHMRLRLIMSGCGPCRVVYALIVPTPQDRALALEEVGYGVDRPRRLANRDNVF